MEFKQENLQKIYKELLLDKDKLSLKELKKKYISKTGLINKAFNEISSIKPNQRAEYGKEANELKKSFEEIILSLSKNNNIYSTKEKIDVSAPFDFNTKK